MFKNNFYGGWHRCSRLDGYGSQRWGPCRGGGRGKFLKTSKGWASKISLVKILSVRISAAKISNISSAKILNLENPIWLPVRSRSPWLARKACRPATWRVLAGSMWPQWLDLAALDALAGSIWALCALLRALAGSICLPWLLLGALTGSIWLQTNAPTTRLEKKNDLLIDDLPRRCLPRSLCNDGSCLRSSLL